MTEDLIKLSNLVYVTIKTTAPRRNVVFDCQSLFISGFGIAIISKPSPTRPVLGIWNLHVCEIMQKSC